MKKLLVAAVMFVVLAGGLIGCKGSTAPTGGAGPGPATPTKPPG